MDNLSNLQNKMHIWHNLNLALQRTLHETQQGVCEILRYCGMANSFEHGSANNPIDLTRDESPSI
jgi:hypothetical protein